MNNTPTPQDTPSSGLLQPRLVRLLAFIERENTEYGHPEFMLRITHHSGEWEVELSDTDETHEAQSPDLDAAIACVIHLCRSAWITAAMARSDRHEHASMQETAAKMSAILDDVILPAAALADAARGTLSMSDMKHPDGYYTLGETGHFQMLKSALDEFDGANAKGQTRPDDA